MDPVKSPRSSKLMRYVGGAIGLGGAALYLILQFGPPTLPKCDASEVRTALLEMLDDTAPPPAAGTAVEQVSETGFDEEKEIRTCAATAKFDGADEKLAYRLTWIDKDEKRFEVLSLSLPRCNRDVVQTTLKEAIGQIEQTIQPPRTVSAVEGISDAGLDAAAETRTCVATAKFDGGVEQKLGYSIQWSDPEKTQYSVQARYEP